MLASHLDAPLSYYLGVFGVFLQGLNLVYDLHNSAVQPTFLCC